MPRSTLNCHVKKEPAFEKLHKTFTWWTCFYLPTWCKISLLCNTYITE
jgi:hypothetical protein